MDLTPRFADGPERREPQHELTDRMHLLAEVTAGLPIGVAIYDLEGRLRFSNRRWSEIVGAATPSTDDLVATLEFEYGEEVGFVAGIRSCLDAGTPFASAAGIRWGDLGPARYCMFSARPFRSEDDRIVGMQCHLDDVTEIWRAGQQFRDRAEIDELTGLLNRATIVDFLDRTLDREKQDGNNTAVLFIDLNEFKSINDRYGHAAGDQLLQQIANYLQGVTRRIDRVGRLGGDEFLVVCPLAGTADDVMRLAERIASGLDDQDLPAVKGRPVSWSIGVALDEAGASSAEGLLAEADAAMYQQKRRRSKKPLLYRSEHLIDLRPRSDIGAAMAAATLDGSVEIRYQAIVDLNTKRILGNEAHAAWRHARSAVEPEAVLEVAERNGSIDEVTDWMLCRIQAEVDRAAGSGRDVGYWALSVSAAQLRHPDFAKRVLDRIGGRGEATEAIVLQQTEAALVDHDPVLIANLSSLSRAGVSIAIDDFALGFGSFRSIPAGAVHWLKIDQAVVADLGRNTTSDAIVEAVARLGTRLGVPVVAKGIANAEQAYHAKKLGVTAGQGPWLHRPSLEPAREIEGVPNTDSPPRR